MDSWIELVQMKSETKAFNFELGTQFELASTFEFAVSSVKNHINFKLKQLITDIFRTWHTARLIHSPRIFKIWVPMILILIKDKLRRIFRR